MESCVYARQSTFSDYQWLYADTLTRYDIFRVPFNYGDSEPGLFECWNRAPESVDTNVEMCSRLSKMILVSCIDNYTVNNPKYLLTNKNKTIIQWVVLRPLITP